MIAYASAEGERLRSSDVYEEQAAFLVRCAVELYSKWATWMQLRFPGCSARSKEGTLRIVHKI